MAKISFNGAPLDGEEHQIEGPLPLFSPELVDEVLTSGEALFRYLKQLGPNETKAYKYLAGQQVKGRSYVSLARMAKETGLRYDQCETFVAKFHAERKIPRLQIVEELEG